MQTCRYSHPMPRELLWPVRSPVTRWPGAVEAAELLDVDVDELTGVLALVAPDRLGRLERAQAVETEAPQHTADGGGGDVELSCDLRAGAPLPA